MMLFAMLIGCEIIIINRVTELPIAKYYRGPDREGRINNYELRKNSYLPNGVPFVLILNSDGSVSWIVDANRPIKP